MTSSWSWSELTALSQAQSFVLAGMLSLLIMLLILLVLALRQRRYWQQQYESMLSNEQNLQQQLNAAGQLASRASERAELLSTSERVLQQALTELRDDNADLKAHLSSQQARHDAREQSAEEKLTLLISAREKLESEFENLANRIFEERSKVFNADSQQRLDSTLGPLREQLGQFRSKVEAIYDSENRDRGELRQQLTELKSLNARIGDDAANLTKALKGDSKIRGNWGEMLLERVLEDSGLHKGREYLTQQSFTLADGSRRQPDVIVRLPAGKSIVIDAKVSLVAYEKYCSATDDVTRQEALTAHIASLRQHIRGLSSKDYEAIDELHSLDFVLAFVPIEAAFSCALENDPSLFKEAYERHIVITSPTTLLASLRTVESIWRYERQDRNAAAIADEAGKLHDQFVLVAEALEEVGRHLDLGRSAWDKVVERLRSGRGNMVRRVQKLEQLGARVKKTLPASMLEEQVSAAPAAGIIEDFLTDEDETHGTPQDR